MTHVTHSDLLTHLTRDPLTHCHLCSAVGDVLTGCSNAMTADLPTSSAPTTNTRSCRPNPVNQNARRPAALVGFHADADTPSRSHCRGVRVSVCIGLCRQTVLLEVFFCKEYDA